MENEVKEKNLQAEKVSSLLTGYAPRTGCKFGDIFTNGINFWMVVFAGEVKNSLHCSCSRVEYELAPVIFENGKPRELISNRRNRTRLEEIKPLTRKIGEIILRA